MTDYKKICEQAARAGGAVLLDWRGRFQVREKAPADLVTEADLASQKTIRELVLAEFPDHDFLGEEDSPAAAAVSDYRWIVDPLDGTTNYVHGMNNYSVSVALEHQGRIIAGAVFDPVADECYTAALGEGAWLGETPIRASDVTELEQALVAVSLPARVQRDSPDIQDFIEATLRCQAVRRMGSAALNLCYLAAGRFDAYWASSTKIWDIAAGVLLVSEAGGTVRARGGGPLELATPNFVAAATPALHAELEDLLT